MQTVSIKMDGQDFAVPKGTTILEAALANRIYIPHLCYHPDLKPAGSCRVCLVEIENGQLVTSCRTPVNDGMVIKTKSPDLDKVRRPIVEMIIASHHMDCKNCAKKGKCELQRIRAFMKIDKKNVERLRQPRYELPLDESNPFFVRDHNKCVLCGICVRTCQEVTGLSAVDFAGRGNDTKIATFGDKPIADSRCISCGECVIRCPVGALVFRNVRRPASEIKTICPYCGVGCGILLGIRDDEIVSIKENREDPVNEGLLCMKGRFGLSFVHSPNRLKSPMIKKGGSFVEVAWTEALKLAAGRLKQFREGEFALIASTKCTNEDNYVAQKFARLVMGSNNIDTPARLSDAPSIYSFLEVTGGNRAEFGPILPHATEAASKNENGFSEIYNASCILIVGADPANSHPVMGFKLKKAWQRGARLLVVSPKEIDLCRHADIWLQPYPGTEPALLTGLAGVIVGEGLLDNFFISRRCDNFDEFKESLEDFILGRVERITGVPKDLIAEAARIYAACKPAVTVWSEELTRYAHGRDSVLAILNLSMITGNIEEGSGRLIPLFTENNTLGAFYMGCLPDLYPGYQPVISTEVRRRLEYLWGDTLAAEPGLPLMDILEATYNERIKILYIVGSDLVNISQPKKIKSALSKAEFVVFQDIFFNEAAKFADVILPAASFAEKDGTFTNSEGRIRLVGKALEPAANSMADWQILCDLAKMLGKKGFDFNCSGDIFSEILSVLSKKSSEISTLQARFRLMPLQYNPPAERSDVDFPLILVRGKDVYSNGILSQNVEGFTLLRKKDFICMNPKDALDYEIKEGEKVRVISRWGEMKGTAKLTSSTPPGVLSTAAAFNQLINPDVDPVSKSLETQMCAVRVEPL
ncbi:MAG: molybdopterin-dependent oxidoreductase [Nitrospirota bacterium]